MAKFKAAGRKGKSSSRRPQGGVACVVLILGAMAFVLLFLYFVMSHANG